MGTFADILPSQPYHLKGYTGHVPGYKVSFGQTFGKSTHHLYSDETYKRTSIPVLNDISEVHDNAYYSREERDAIKKRCEIRSCKYTTNIIPGYAGYVPQYKFLCGKMYT